VGPDTAAEGVIALIRPCTNRNAACCFGRQQHNYEVINKHFLGLILSNRSDVSVGLSSFAMVVLDISYLSPLLVTALGELSA
jgi:hypothetical protein